MSPSPFILLGASSNTALLTFAIYTLAVLGLAWLSSYLRKGKKFVSEYFLGSRSLGVWAFALTFAATSASGGSFTGFPSKIYSHGWILGLWIGSYIVVPICAMGLLGKRLNHVARKTGAITVPDVIRDRFESRQFGLLAVLLIIFFMSFNLIAQFKAGSLILRTLLEDSQLFANVSTQLGSVLNSTGIGQWGLFVGVSHEYLLCLVCFGVAVIFYTTFGGFHAVVWTDVMQGVVMVVGVLIMLPLAINQAGGLEQATRRMASMKPPVPTAAKLTVAGDEEQSLSGGTWLAMQNDERLFRLPKPAIVGSEPVDVELLEIVTPDDIATVMGEDSSEVVLRDVSIEIVEATPYAYGADIEGAYVTGPGPSEKEGLGFLPLSLAVSFFFMWAISGAGQPSSMVRLMAFRDTQTLRKAIFTVAIYYSLIYFPLVIIFCCARVVLPGMDAESDRIMPAMAVHLTSSINAAWLAGILVAAPFAAVMSTVDSFLLMISSAVVRDVYQRNINPEASEKSIKNLSYMVTLVIGSLAMFGAVNPPQFLQDIIVYTGSGLAACFLAPMIYALYWPRSTRFGCMTAMLSGFAAHLSMYIAGIFANGSFFRPYKLFDLDPILIGLFTSFVIGFLATKLGPPAEQKLVERYFYRPVAK